jgi:pyruvate,water dikinase
MSATLDDTTPLVREPIPLPVQPPPGYWIREATHAPLPWTTLTDVVLGEAVPRGMQRMYAEFGVPFQTLEYRKIGGWDYVRLVPLGGKQPPPLPAWLAALMLPVVPAVRRRSRSAVAAIRSDLAGTLIRRWAAEWRPELIARTAELREVDAAQLDDAGLDEHLGRVIALVEDGLMVHFRLHGPLMVALADLAFTCRDLLGWDETQVFRLLVGTSRMSTAPARELAALAATAARRPKVRRLIEDDVPLPEVLFADHTFAAEFAAYLREYGCRALSYEVADPCLDDQPGLVLALVRDQLRTGYDPDATDESNRAGRAASRAEAGRLLAARSAADRRRFERALERALLAYPVREDNEFHTFSAPQGLLHRTVLEIGRRLAGRGLLDTSEDVFHLVPDQLRTALREGLDCRAGTSTRAAERAWAIAHPGPASFGPPPGPPPSLRWLPAEARLVTEATGWMFEQAFGTESRASTGQPAAEATLIPGVGASPGRYTGPARIIRGESEFDRLQPGDVLVCQATSPVWSVLFAGIGALVADGGGLLSHQAIIAREYGVPAVVGTHDGTTRLTDGQLVTVDGTAGTVQVRR